MIRWLKRLLVLAFLLMSTLAHGQGKTQLRLLLSHETARPGETVTAGLQLKMQPRWHTYWRNPGDSGIATKIADWTLPTSVTADAIQWPIPQKARYKSTDTDLTTLEFHDEVILLIPLHIAPAASTGKLELKANVRWLECEAEGQCVPGRGAVTASLTIGTESKLSADKGLIETARQQLPSTDAPANVSAGWQAAGSTNGRPLAIEWPVKAAPAAVDFYPYEGAANGGFKYETLTEASVKDGKARVKLLAKEDEGKWPEKITGLLVQKAGDNEPRTAYEVTLPIQASAKSSPVNDGKPGATSAQTPAAPTTAGSDSLVLNLWFAFLGGVILNIMPCVFPVIALKIFGFVAQAREQPGQVRRLGLIYALGVLASFLVLALLVIGLKAAGSKIGWGFQFSNPYFLIAMTTLVALITLNLFGIFEVTLGGNALTAAAELSSKSGASGAFFNGLLATVLATSCSAPVLGTAIGFAFRNSPAVIILMFLMVGVGLAAPYVALSWNPAWLKLLPRPGPWMEKFKVAMGFPMLLATLWLADIVADHYGSRAWWLSVFLVFVAAAAWVYGEFVQRGSTRRGLAACFVLALLGTGYAWALESKLDWRSPVVASAGANNSIEHAPAGYAWQAWSTEAVQKARDAGHVVIVDFTAKWCVTCNTIVKPALGSASVREKLKAVDAVALLGNYTAFPPEITDELARYGKAAVPLVLVFPRDATKPAIVLPEAITPGMVVDALEQAAK